MKLAGLDLTGIKGLLLDLDNTLYAYAPAHDAAIRVAHEKFPVSMPFDEFYVQYRAARQKVIDQLAPQGACRSRYFAFQILCEARDIPAPFEQAMLLENIYWDRFLKAMKPDMGMLSLLKRAKEAGLKTCAVSDMTATIQSRKLIQLGMSRYIDCMVTSEESGAEKPDARIFKLALHKLRLDADAVLMLGDDQAKDVAGAKAAGINAEHYAAALDA